MDSSEPPFYPLTSTNHAALVVVAAVTFLIYAVIGVAAKLLIRLSVTSIKSHDVVLLIAGVIYIIQTALVIVACNHGLGQHRQAVSPSDFDKFSKFLYASDILAIGVNGLAKISVCLLIRHIKNSGHLNIANLALGVIIAVWIAVGILTTAFQCHLPSPWVVDDSHQCSSRGPIFVFNGVMNILTDLALCVIPIAMMWRVHAKTKTKSIIVCLFGTRIIVPALVIPSLVKARYLFHTDSDASWLAVSSSIWYQISLGLTIITACIPGLKGVIDSLLGSTAVAAIGAPYELRSGSKGDSGFQIAPLRNDGSKGPSQSHGSGSGNTHGRRFGLKGKQKAPLTWNADREIEIKYGGTEDAKGSDEGSESVRKLTEGVIVVRDEFELHFDDASAQESHEGSRNSKEMGDHRYTKAG